MRFLAVPGFLVMTMVCAGCGSLMYGTTGRDQAALERAEIERLKVDFRRLHEQVVDLSEAQERSYAEMGALKAGQDALRRDIDQQLGTFGQSLKTESVERARMRDELRTEIVGDVSQKVGTMLRQQAPARPSASSSRGYEHVVKPGETLSEIASVYGIKVSDVTSANNLTDANTIRVGQTLFIPAAGGAR